MKKKTTTNKYENYASFSLEELKHSISELEELINKDNAILKARWSYRTFKRDQYETKWFSVTGSGLTSLITTFTTICLGAAIHDVWFFEKYLDQNLVSLCGVSAVLTAINIAVLSAKIHKIHKSAKESTSKVADINLLNDKTSDMVLIQRVDENRKMVIMLKKEIKVREAKENEERRSFRFQ